MPNNSVALSSNGPVPYLNIRHHKLGTIIIQTVHILQHESVYTGSLPMEEFSKHNPNNPARRPAVVSLHLRTNVLEEKKLPSWAAAETCPREHTWSQSFWRRASSSPWSGSRRWGSRSDSWWRPTDGSSPIDKYGKNLVFRRKNKCQSMWKKYLKCLQ